MMNANNPMTPGVYTVEKNAFPPSVAEVPTAIPAFLGYTEFATKNGKPLTEPLLINSLAEYREHFGGAPPFKYPISSVPKIPPATAGGASKPPKVYDFEINGNYYSVGAAAAGNAFYLYHCLQLFYQNGGGPCYITSVGSYYEVEPGANGGAPTKTPTTPDKADFLDGLAKLPRIPFPKPTMISTPDALLLDEDGYYTVQEQVLGQCGELGDRIGLIDVYNGWQSNSSYGVIDNHRNKIGNNNLKFGVSYYPFLDTTIVDSSNVTYANVDQDAANQGVDLNTIFPGQNALALLASMTDDYNSSLQLTIPPQVNFGAATPAATLPAASATVAGAMPFPSWTIAFSAAPSGTDLEAPLKWQMSVVYSMALVLKTLADGGQINNPAVSLSSTDLVKGIQSMMKPTGYIASVLTGLVPYSKSFPQADLGILSKATLASVMYTGAGGDQPDPSTANPYGDDITTQGAAFPLASSAIKNAFNIMNNAINQVAQIASTLLSQYNTSLENANPNYKNLMEGIAKEASKLPPCPAMAGVMTLVDNSEGVWISPANRNINSVTAPTVSINNDEQASLNVDALAGKSINAIRSFYGRGPAIIWGARTLDGNSMDWRYISVRRTMIMMEQSIANAAFEFVFDSNDASTWGTVEGMISNFLHNLWSSGALQGASPADAYTVNVGLGKTMTPVDILNGIMRVEVKAALVRPAEFIIITYEQQMATSG